MLEEAAFNSTSSKIMLKTMSCLRASMLRRREFPTWEDLQRFSTAWLEGQSLLLRNIPTSAPGSPLPLCIAAFPRRAAGLLARGCGPMAEPTWLSTPYGSTADYSVMDLLVLSAWRTCWSAPCLSLVHLPLGIRQIVWASLLLRWAR